MPNTNPNWNVTYISAVRQGSLETTVAKIDSWGPYWLVQKKKRMSWRSLFSLCWLLSHSKAWLANQRKCNRCSLVRHLGSPSYAFAWLFRTSNLHLQLKVGKCWRMLILPLNKSLLSLWLRKKEERKVYLHLHKAMEALLHISNDGCWIIGPSDKVLKGSQVPRNFIACKRLKALVHPFYQW